MRNYGVEVSKVFKKGMTIGCIAPASSSDESLDAIQEICEEHGYQIIFGESCYRTGLYGAALRSRHKSLNG